MSVEPERSGRSVHRVDAGRAPQDDARRRAVGPNARRAWWFLGVTFVATWVPWWALAALSGAGGLRLDDPLGWTLLIVGGSAPTVAAYVAVWRTPEAGTLREFNGRVFRFRAPLGPWVVAVAGATVLGIAGMALAGLVTEVSWPDASWRVAATFLPVLASSIVFGGAEEVGWRGVLQPAVSARWNLGVASLVIGTVWALWHLPLFWVVGGVHQGASFTSFLLAGIGYSAIMTWLYARTQSVMVCVVFHAGINGAATFGLAFTIADTYGYAVQAAVVLAVGTALVALARGRSERPADDRGLAGRGCPARAGYAGDER
jgi:uncharacterized protein